MSELNKQTIEEGLKSLKFRTQLFIDGAFVDAESKETFATENPATGKELAQIAAGDAADVDKAVKSARAALAGWSGLAPSERKELLFKWCDLIDEARLELSLLETLEAGKPISECYEGDIPQTSECIRWHAEAVDKVNDSVTPTEKNVVSLVRREPIGVVGAVLPWNFSALMCAWKLGPALATGNVVVVKPAQQTSLATLRMAELAVQAGIPKGVFNVVTGLGATAGQALGRHMDVDMCTFTGSTLVGRLFLKYAAETNLKRISLEMGGKSPQLVFADCALEEGFLEKVAAECTSAAFWNMSENCSCGSRLIVHESIADELVALIEKELDQEWKVGDPLDPAIKVGSLIEAQHLKKVMGFIELGKKLVESDGIKLVRGGNQVRTDSGGYFVEPTIFTNVKNSSDLAQKEIFGPVLSVITFKTEAEAIEIANDVPYGLASSLYSTNLNIVHRVAQQIKAGTVSVNCFSEGDMTAPFGGYKESGFVGRDKSIWAHEQYQQLKTTWIQLH